MRKYTTAVGVDYDLDDPKTYERLPQTVGEVLQRIYEKLGFALLYTHAFDFDSMEAGKAQLDRLEDYVRQVSEVWGKGTGLKPLSYWQEMLFILLDEIENMC